jgi:hypothetical protein
LGASAITRLGSGRAEDGTIAAKAVVALASASREVAVWCVDAALAGGGRSAARASFESFLRSEGAQVLADVLRLGRFAREG